tara:strand:+ start:345 stop:761 length:417 start_codon:yes stop_codon:yes gene_type:complete
MAEEKFDNVRLSLMQDFLPVGVAIFNRARAGGLREVWEALNAYNEPFKELRSEGEPMAKSLRDKLDQISPGLGNPVTSVSITVDEMTNDEMTNDETKDIPDEEMLVFLLDRIDKRLDLLRNYFSSDSKDKIDINNVSQ